MCRPLSIALVIVWLSIFYRDVEDVIIIVEWKHREYLKVEFKTILAMHMKYFENLYHQELHWGVQERSLRWNYRWLSDCSFFCIREGLGWLGWLGGDYYLSKAACQLVVCKYRQSNLADTFNKFFSKIPSRYFVPQRSYFAHFMYQLCLSISLHLTEP